VNGDCLCLNLGIECWCTRPGPGGSGYAPHGTAAAARRHYRREGPGWKCGPCRRAETQRAQDRWQAHLAQRAPEPAGDGRVIRDLRLAAGLSQRELADAAGISQQSLSSYETGRHRPAAAVLAQVTAALTGELSRAA